MPSLLNSPRGKASKAPSPGQPQLRQQAPKDQARIEHERLLRELEAPSLAAEQATGSATAFAKAIVGNSFIQSRQLRGHKHMAAVLAYAYGVAFEISKFPDKRQVISEIGRQIGWRVSARTDEAAIAVRAVVDYGQEEEFAANRQYASNHAQALRYLLSERVDPKSAFSQLSCRKTSHSVLCERWRQRLRTRTAPAKGKAREANQQAGRAPAASEAGKPSRRPLAALESAQDWRKGSLGLALVEHDGSQLTLRRFLPVSLPEDMSSEDLIVLLGQSLDTDLELISEGRRRRIRRKFP